MHFADPTLTLVAGVSFILSYLLGLKVASHLRPSYMLPAVIFTVLGFVVRAASPPLSFGAIASISAVHFFVACLTVFILRNTRPVK